MDVYKNYYIAMYGNKKYEVVKCHISPGFRTGTWHQDAIVDSIEEGEKYIENQTGVKYSYKRGTNKEARDEKGD